MAYRFTRSRRIRLSLLLAAAIGAVAYSRQFHPESEDIAGQRLRLAARSRTSAPLRIDAATLLGDVRALAAPAMEGREVGTPGGRKAREYLLGRFAAIGLAPVGTSYEQAFSFTPRRGVRFWRAPFWRTPRAVSGVNVVGAVLGAVDPDRYLLVTAHYDHLGLRNGTLYPGADDNASGVAAMLAAAGYFRAHRPRHSLLFVAFDGEERGLRGASAFLEQPPVALDAMLVDVNFDMLSRSPAGEVFLSGLYANPQLRPLVDPVRARAAPAMLYGHDAPRPFWNGDDWTDQSDHGAFNDRHIPFLYVGVEDHPDYHRPTDTADRIDQDFYVGVADAVVDLIDALDAASPAQLARRHQAVSGE